VDKTLTLAEVCRLASVRYSLQPPTTDAKAILDYFIVTGKLSEDEVKLVNEWDDQIKSASVKII
jgi:hypothetical protein